MLFRSGPETFNNACRSCHVSLGKSKLVCSASASERKASNDNCSGCHMPKNNTIDIPHVTTTDHFIRRPIKSSYKREVKEFLTLACINNSGADRRSKGIAFLNYYEKFVQNRSYLDSAEKLLAPNSDLDFLNGYDALVRLKFLKEDYRGVLELKNRHAALHGEGERASTSMDRAWT